MGQHAFNAEIMAIGQDSDYQLTLEQLARNCCFKQSLSMNSHGRFFISGWAICRQQY